MQNDAGSWQPTQHILPGVLTWLVLSLLIVFGLVRMEGVFIPSIRVVLPDDSTVNNI